LKETCTYYILVPKLFCSSVSVLTQGKASLAQPDLSAQAREGLASRLYLTRPRCKTYAAPIRLQKELKNVIKDILSNTSSHCSMGQMLICKLHLSRKLLYCSQWPRLL